MLLQPLLASQEVPSYSRVSQGVDYKIWSTGSQAAYRSVGEVEGRRATREVSAPADSVSMQYDATDAVIAPCASDVVAEAIRHAVHVVTDTHAPS